MKVIFVGGGVTSCLAAINLKYVYKSDIDVLIIEKNEELLKKLTITGNGRCNIANIFPLSGLIIDNKDLKEEFSKYSIEDIKDFYNKIGLPIINKDGLYYPFNDSANATRDYLVSLLEKNGVKIIKNAAVLNYFKENGGYTVVTNNSKYSADCVVFATGGKSYEKTLGASDSILSVLKEHKYNIKDFKSALCALKIKEDVKRLDGVRVKTVVKVLDKTNKVLFEEPGEVLFKKDGLSGICIFNTSLWLRKNVKNLNDIKINMNFLYGLDQSYLDNIPNSSISELLPLMNKKIIQYLEHKGIKNSIEAIKYITNVNFSVVDYYGFDNAQISYGGVSLSDINNNLESTKESNIYFGGELLDISGYCGGYNLSMCLISALIISKNFIKK